MKINLRESLNRLDLQTDNKYDLLNTFNCNNISNDKKKKLAEALNKNASAKTISRMLNESYDKYGYLKESLSEDFSEAEIKAVNDWNNRKRRKYGYKYYPEKYYGNFDIYVDGYELYYPEDIDYSDSLADTVAYLKSKIKSGEIKYAIITDADIYYPHTDEHVELWRSDNRFGEENYGYNPDIIRFYKNAKYTEAFDEEIDLNYETDFDESEVEEDVFFSEDGKDYAWVERIAGPIHLDFDNWAVWSAKEIVSIQDFIIGKNEQGSYDIDEAAYRTAVNSNPTVYFVVEEDTGFIDWGPVETATEAQDFLNDKVEDFENDEEYEEIEIEEESLTESKPIINDGDYEITLHYDDIGNGKEYDYTLDYDEVVEYLMELAWENGEGPEDASEDEYLEWVMDNFDELADKYELNVLNYFEDEASQHEYDHRYDEP